jgi:hypothetical protein
MFPLRHVVSVAGSRHFLTPRRNGMMRTVSTLLMALVLAFAVQVVWAIGVGWSTTIGSAFSTKPVQVEEFLSLLADGTPIIRRIVESDYDAASSKLTLDRKLVPESAKFADRLVWLAGVPKASQLDRRLPWAGRIRGFLAAVGPEKLEAWYSIAEPDGLLWLVGFDLPSNRIVGYLGSAGFRTTPPPPNEQFRLSEPFGRLWNLADVARLGVRFRDATSSSPVKSHMLGLMDELVEIDFENRKVTTLWKGTGTIDVGILMLAGRDDNRWGTVIRTANHLHCVPSSPAGEFTVDLPEVLREPMFTVSPLTPKSIEEKTVTVISGLRSNRVGYFAKLTTDRPATVVEIPLENTLIVDGPITWPFAAALTPQPVGLVASRLLVAKLRASSEESSTWEGVLAEEWPRLWQALAVVTAVSACLASLAWRRQRRYGLSLGVLWAGFVLLFGVPGWLAYRWHRAWPALEACPACGAMAPRDREACCRCGAAFPPPRRESFEIRD